MNAYLNTKSTKKMSVCVKHTEYIDAEARKKNQDLQDQTVVEQRQHQEK